jgi:hypothetical protein
MKHIRSRRDILKAAAVGAAVLAGQAPLVARQAGRNRPPENRKLKLGLASYSLRKFDLNQTFICRWTAVPSTLRKWSPR